MKQANRARSPFHSGFERVLSIFLVSLLLGGCLRDSVDTEQASGSDVSAVRETCRLQIQFGGDRSDKQFDLPCPDGTTVFDLLRSADADEKIELDATGSGATAFVTAIDGVANRGGNGHNWVYYVNDQLGDRSAGVCPVNAGDEVRWTFGAYPPPDPANTGSTDLHQDSDE